MNSSMLMTLSLLRSMAEKRPGGEEEGKEERKGKRRDGFRIGVSNSSHLGHTTLRTPHTPRSIQYSYTSSLLFLPWRSASSTAPLPKPLLNHLYKQLNSLTLEKRPLHCTLVAEHNLQRLHVHPVGGRTRLEFLVLVLQPRHLFLREVRRVCTRMDMKRCYSDV